MRAHALCLLILAMSFGSRHEMLASRRMVCMALGWEDHKYLWTLDRFFTAPPRTRRSAPRPRRS